MIYYQRWSQKIGIFLIKFNLTLYYLTFKIHILLVLKKFKIEIGKIHLHHV